MAAMDASKLLAIADEFLAGAVEPNEKEYELFQLTTSDDVQHCIHQIQSTRHLKQNMINMKRIDPFLTGMEHFEKVLIALKFEDVPKIMACIWGPLRFLLEITNLTDREIDNLLEAYKKIGKQLPRFYEYVGLFSTLSETVPCLLHIYQDIITFHQLAYRLHVFSPRKNLFQKIYKSAWRELNVTIDHLLGALEKHDEFIRKSGSSFRSGSATPDMDSDSTTEQACSGSDRDRERIADDFSNYMINLRRYRENFEESEKERKEQAKRRVLAWISASKKTDSLHRKFQDTRICPGTGRWLFKRYRNVSHWMKEEQPPESALWLQASRGFGKTILASLLIDELGELRTKEIYGVPPGAKIYHFYCQEEDSEHRTHLDILRGILHQMVDANEELLPFCIDKAQSTGNPSLSDTQTAHYLIEAFVEYNTRQYIIIDGIDECETSEVREMAKYFLGQVTKRNKDTQESQLRLLFMSQPIAELTRDGFMPDGDARVQLKATDNAEDIKFYVKKRLVDFSKGHATRIGFNLSESDKDQIESSVCHRSEEMFLYAHLAIEYLLQQPTKEKLKEKMKEDMAPKELSQIYEKLLGIVRAELLSLTEGQAHWDMAKQLLGWLVCAKRPLRWHEMQSILSYNPDQQKVDFDNRMLRQDANKYLGSLVQVLDGGHFRIVHSTARRYIIQNRYINDQAVYCELAVICLRYLCLLTESNHYDDEERREKVKLGWFSFQDYACSQWHSHISTVIEMCSDLFYDTGYGQKYGTMFGAALQEFMNKHGADMAKSQHQDIESQMPTALTRFSRLPFYDNLCNLWNHIYTHQKGEYEVRNTVGIKCVDQALLGNRTFLERFNPQMEAYHEDTIEDYYGPNLFKCKRLLCRFFYVGYDKIDDREAHDSRHDRAFHCPLRCNAAPVGFRNEKDQQKHVRIYHPEQIKEPSVFEPMRPRNSKRTFRCSMCNKMFTRKSTLIGHEYSHLGERPYKCPSCGKAFARSSDCKRHQKSRAHRAMGSGR